MDLYETDFPVWAEEQAAALRARGAGGNLLDYDNLAEEIEGLVASWNNQARSLTRNIIRHLYKLAYSPAELPRNHWTTEVLTWRADLQDLMTGSMRRRLRPELSSLHDKALELARADCLEYGETLKADVELRWSLEQVLGELDDPLPPRAN